MAVLNVQDAVVSGLAEAFVAAGAGGDSFANNGHVFLEVDNGGGGAINVVIDSPNVPAPEGATQYNPDVTVAVAAGARKIIGPFPPFRFNDASGLVNVSYSGVVTVTVRAVRLMR